MSAMENTLNLNDSATHLMQEVAGAAFMTYVRPVTLEDNSTAYAVCSEEGVQLALFNSEEAAYFSARQNNLHPVRVH